MLTALVPVALSGDDWLTVTCRNTTTERNAIARDFTGIITKGDNYTLDNSHLKSMKSLWFCRIMQQIITGLQIPAIFAFIPQRTFFVEVHFTCIIWWWSWPERALFKSFLLIECSATDNHYVVIIKVWIL